MTTDTTIEIVQVTQEQLPLLEDLWREDWLEAHPSDEAGAQEAVDGIRHSRDHYDFLRSDSFWLLAAQIGPRFVGYITLVRIPKADHRKLFLFIDELFVLPSCRHQGVANALLQAAMDLGSSVGAHGIRLVVDKDNEAARRLYAASGFGEGVEIFSQRQLP